MLESEVPTLAVIRVSPRNNTVTGSFPPARKRSAAIDSDFRHGNRTAALSTRVTPSTIGSAGWRFRATAAELARHNARNATNNVTLAGLDPDPRPRRRPYVKGAK